MKILIPSSNRWDKSTTYDNLPRGLQREVSLVVPEDQWRRYTEAGLPAVATPRHVIGPTRQWICDSYGPKVLMLDDD